MVSVFVREMRSGASSVRSGAAVEVALLLPLRSTTAWISSVPRCPR